MVFGFRDQMQSSETDTCVLLTVLERHTSVTVPKSGDFQQGTLRKSYSFTAAKSGPITKGMYHIRHFFVFACLFDQF
jgi:hypothetical protein